MTQIEQSQASPALTASQNSWRCVQAHDREGWLALMADDVVVEDPIGKSVTNPDGTGVRGKEAVGAFFDTNIAANQLTITCEETFPSSSPTRSPISWCWTASLKAGSPARCVGCSPTRSTRPGSSRTCAATGTST